MAGTGARGGPGPRTRGVYAREGTPRPDQIAVSSTELAVNSKYQIVMAKEKMKKMRNDLWYLYRLAPN
jgi:hypothetical protein